MNCETDLLLIDYTGGTSVVPVHIENTSKYEQRKYLPDAAKLITEIDCFIDLPIQNMHEIRTAHFTRHLFHS